MIRLGLLLLTLGLTMVFLSLTTISGNTQTTVNFLHSYGINIPSFVTSVSVNLVENKSDVNAIILILNGSSITTVTTPYSGCLSSGDYHFVVLKEINTTTGKALNTSQYYNVTLFFKITKAYVVSNPKAVLIQGVILSLVGSVLLVRDIYKHFYVKGS
ncbi:MULTISPECIES: hypothetical protein [unclassified Stygiolobus]|uniref:hypothetical protein n=1 Tax=unclassified Stygiolobus TaxID=2824672 RepID=UPI00307F890C